MTDNPNPSTPARTTKQTIYVPDEMWHRLRVQAVEHGCTASAQVVALIEHYLQFGLYDPFTQSIMGRAREITKGARGQ